MPRSIHAPLLLLPLVAGLAAQQEGGGTAVTNGFPRTWDEEAMATLELPSVLTGEPARPVSAEFYYAVPARTIHRTYPLYVPGEEPEGYMEELLAREPEVVMGPGDDYAPYADWTDEEWIRAGQEVYRTAVRTVAVPPGVVQMIADRSRALGVPEVADGRLPFMRATIEEKGQLSIGGLSCASCHTRVMPDGALIEGAQGNEPFDRAFAEGLAEIGEEAAAPRVTSLFGAPAVDGVEPTFPAEIDGTTIAAAHRAIPPGVIARHGTSSFSPVQVPDLIGLEDRRYLDRTGLQRHRGIGDLMRYSALNQGMDRLSSWAGYIPDAEALKADLAAGSLDEEGFAEGLAALEDPATRLRYSDPQLYALAKYVYSLEPPENPHPMDALAREGEEIFELECSDCHPAPLYTSNQLVPAPGFEPSDELRATEAIRARAVGTDARLTMTTRRGTGLYKIPSLRGVWYRGPLSHDGSVATLEDWFDPRRLRDDYVPTGWNPGGGARAVRGHEFGLDLSAPEREALIAFLRTL